MNDKIDGKSNEKLQSIERIKTIFKAALILLVVSIVALIITLVNNGSEKLPLDAIIYGGVSLLSLIISCTSLICYIKRKNN